MATFYYKATNTGGKVETGSLEVSSKQAALSKLERMGLFPLSVSDKQIKGGDLNFNFDVAQWLPANRISGSHVLDFTDKLATLLRAGLPLAKALTLLIETTEHEPMRDLIREVLKDVKAGKGFAESLARHPKVFERLYINMVKTGEAAGVLESVLINIREFLQRRQELKSFLVTSLLYPGLLAMFALTTILVLVLFVLPRFQEVFDQLGQELPFITKLLVDTTAFMSMFKIPIAIIVIVGWVAFSRWKGTDKGALQWDMAKLKMPMIGKLLTEIEVARFSNTLGILLRSSVSLLESMSIAREIAENRVFKAAMDPIIKGIKKGDGISGPMAKTGVFPKMSVHLVTVGEETGNLGDMFTKIAGIYQESLEHLIKRFLSLFEPVMILIMFVVVGFIVAAMLMAVTSLSTTAM